jgi:ArsR family transcriptional regulator, arsenate/arsenite/antimonite-responsive transcriptional repressor
MPGNIERVRNMDIDDAVIQFGALSAPSRIEIVRLLAREAPPEGMPSGDIADKLGVVQNTMSSQLLILSNARIVRSRRMGRQIFYRLDLEALADLVDFIVNDCADGKLERPENTTKRQRVQSRAE